MGAVCTTELIRFMTDCLKAAGCIQKAAEQHAQLLYEADRCGHKSHGLNRLERYVHDIETGACCPNNKPKILHETAATAWVDANNVLGSTAGHFATDIAIKKAKQSGVGWVAVKGSNHYGIGGFWSNKIADNGMLGMAFTNGSPLVAPTRSRKAALGTNPVAIAAPALAKTGFFYLDMSTSAVSLGKIEMSRRRGEKIPLGWAQGPDGKETTDADLAYKTGCLMPLGGSEETAGYKGFGLSAVVDIVSGILSGADYGHHVKRWSPVGKSPPANLGQCFVALNHTCFAPCFEERVTEIIDYWRNMKPADPKLPVRAPGDFEKISAAKTDSSGSITYLQQQLDGSAKLAKRLNVKPMEVQKV